MYVSVKTLKNIKKYEVMLRLVSLQHYCIVFNVFNALTLIYIFCN